MIGNHPLDGRGFLKTVLLVWLGLRSGINVSDLCAKQLCTLRKLQNTVLAMLQDHRQNLIS